MEEEEQTEPLDLSLHSTAQVCTVRPMVAEPFMGTFNQYHEYLAELEGVDPEVFQEEIPGL